MLSIALTGANGFLGWHTRCAAHAQGAEVRAVPVGDLFTLDAAAKTISNTDRLIHLAGVNRASDEQVHDGNLLFVEQASEALLRAENPPAVVVYANSTQAGNGTVYGTAKSIAAEILRAAAEKVGSEFVEIVLPNLFGEHGRPFYNSVVATFCHQLANEEEPVVDHDRELTLLHAQHSAELLLGLRGLTELEQLQERATVGSLRHRLTEFAETYAAGDIPDVSTLLDRDLFNTYRSFTFPAHAPVQLARHSDERGSFFEIIRSHGGSGQNSFSTTAPGVSRGDHYHLRKIERFTVLSGNAVISLRKMFTTDVIEFPVSGEVPQAIDMPTMWAHNIVNTGGADLYTSFWSNELFDPADSDTFAEAV